MNAKKFSSLFELITIFLCSCGISNDVHVVNFSPIGKVGQLTTFTIEFSENLAPSDKQNQWLNDEFIEFEPKIPGQFKWVSGNMLIFSPNQPLQPIQSYTAKITNRVMFDSKLSYNFDKYIFQTPDFDAIKAEFFWSHVPNEKFKVSVKANLHFNYPVNPGMLKDYLSIECDGASKTNYQIISEEAADIIALNIGDITQTDKEQKYKVTIKNGLLSTVGKKPLEDTREFEYDLPPITKLVINDVSTGFDGQTGWIEVHTTQMADEKQIRNFVNVTPSKNLKFYVNENSFRIEGEFNEAAVVNLKIAKGLPGLYGGDLESEFEQEVSFVNLNPSISFSDRKGKYLMLGGQHNLQLNAVNISGAEIEVSQVFKNNILFFVSQYSYTYSSDSDEYNNFYFYEGDIDRFGKSLYKDNVRLGSGQNWLQKFNVNLERIYQQKLKGIFVIQAHSNSDRWISASKMLSLSDLGIIAKKADNELIVFVNSIATTEPVKKVEINLISSNNQTLLTGKTDSDGIIHFKNIKENLKGFTPRVITAETEGDFNYIDLLETGVESSRFDVGGTRTSQEGYRTFLYGDRNIYRPGERVNITGIVRDDFTKPVKDVPVQIKIISPSGKQFDEYKKNLNWEGSFEITFEVPGYAQTGEYRAEVYTGAGSLIGTYNFSIEDFVPDKIRLTLRNDKTSAKPGESVKIGIDAEYLFGAKASGLRYESDIQFRHKQFYSKKYASYNFGNSTITNSNIQNAFDQGTLDEQGKGEITHIIPADIKSYGIATMYAFVSVFDPTGRTVNKATSVDVYPEKYFIGIKPSGYYFATNEKINFNFVGVDKNDNAARDLNTTVKLVRFEWQTVLKKDNSGRYYYASEKKDIQEWEKDFNLSGGEKSLPVIVTKSGEYEIKISRKGSNYYQYYQFYAYGWASTTASSFEVDKEGRIEIVSDKQTYAPGEKAKILFTAPFSGKMLITFERSGIYEYKYINVKEKSTQLEIELQENFVPNIYVTATLFKKHDANNSAPFLVGHGFLSLKVERKDYKLPVSISAPQKIKPNTKQEIIIKTIPEKNVFVTLAAVDEGILQIKNYTAPDPYGFMYAKRALEVESYDLYKLLLPEVLAIKSSTGGDELAKQLQKRTNPVTSKRFNLVALWSGIKKTGGDGIVKVPITIPQFNGEIRLMAVAYTGQRFGSADAEMKVANDLIIEPQMPRFLAPNDSLVMPVTVINTTNKNGSVNISVKTEGLLRVVSSKSESVNVPPNSSRQVNFAIAANNQTGTGKITIETSGIAKVKEETNISVRPVSPYVNETSSGTLYAGSEVKLNIGNNFIAGTKSSSITISKFPAVQFAKVLKNLVGYPHGCIEQTVSKLFPQLYFEDLAKLVAPEHYKTNNPIYYVKEGIKKLELMQQWSGGMSYWPGETDVNWWGSVYTAHFLLEAKKAGFDVSENVLSKLLNFLSTKSREKSTYDYTTYSGNSRSITKIANKEILYSLYVLALAGKGDISTMNYYKSRLNLISEDCKYLLAGAYALMGKWNNYYEIVPPQFKQESTGRETGGSFDSDIRANAIMLNVLDDVEPSNKQIPFIVKYLSKNIDRVYSTQERAFTFIGLGKAARKNSASSIKVDLFSGKNKIASFDNKDLSVQLNNGITQLTLKAYGSGEVYYFLNTDGVKTGNVDEHDSHIQLRRKYYDYRTQSEISSNNFYQGQLIVCKISLSSSNVYAKNIAISDLIPSGFEIENPRLSGNSQLQWENSQPINVQYTDIRDDRIILFTSVEQFGTKNFYYMLRVVNKGKFQMPVISGEAMYDPEIHSINGRGVIRVSQK
jgi:alpha-2-macroglobulin